MSQEQEAWDAICMMLPGSYSKPVEKLADGFMLMAFAKSKPGGETQSKKLVAEAEAKHGVLEPGRVKSGINVYNTDYLKAVGKLDNATHNILCEMTEAWAERSVRLCPNGVVQKAKKIFADFEVARDKLVNEFLDSHEAHKNRDQQVLGTLFDASLYPSVGELREKFSTSLTFSTVPDPDQDVRAGWSSEMKSIFQAETIKTEKDRTKKIVDSVLAKAKENIEHQADRCNSYTGKRDGSFRKKLVSNVRDSVDMVRAFNFTKDVAIDQWCDDVLSELCTVTPQDLRESTPLRKEIAKKAVELSNRMGSLGEAKLQD